MRRLQPNPTPLPPAECRRRSRAELETRVLTAVTLGDGVTVIARRPHMPRAATLNRWIARDARFGERYRTALRVSRYVLADDMLVMTSQAFTKARTERQRATAVRMRFDLMKWWVKTFGDTANKRGADKRGANDVDGDQMVAILNAGLEKARADARAKAAARADGAAATDSPSPSSREAPSHLSSDVPSPLPLPEGERTTETGSLPDGEKPITSDPPNGERATTRGSLPNGSGREDGVRSSAAAPTPQRPAIRTPASAPAAAAPAKPRPKESPPEPAFDRRRVPIRRDPPGTWTVRFDVDVPRPRDEGMSSYDPLKW